MNDGTNKKLLVTTNVFSGLLASMARADDPTERLVICGIVALLLVVYICGQVWLDTLDRKKNLTETKDKEQ